MIMRIQKHLLFKSFLLCLTISIFSFTPFQSDNDFSFDIKKVYPAVSISKLELKAALSLKDLNSRYPSSWIRTYNSVEITTTHQGELKTSIGTDDTLTPEQFENLLSSDQGVEVNVKVSYIPENSLKDNPAKELEFNFLVNPDIDANFPGGENQLKSYLEEQAIKNIPISVFSGYDLAVLKFTVNESGEITEAQVFASSKDDHTDKILLETICNMPSWEPASYSTGLNVQQDFAFLIGNMEGCNRNILKLNKD